jgi:hypothetical protein
MASSEDPFFGQRIDILWEGGRFRAFIPNPRAPVAERLNALMRFGIYVGIIWSIYRRNWTWLLFAGLATAVACHVVWHILGPDDAAVGVKILVPALRDGESDVDAVQAGKTRFSKTKRVRKRVLMPTVDNPYMNPSPVSFGDGALPVAAANAADPAVRELIENVANRGRVEDTSDIWDKREGLQFHSIAGGPIGDMNGEFRAFIFPDIHRKTRKEENSNFGPALLDTRSIVPNVPYPYLNPI